MAILDGPANDCANRPLFLAVSFYKDAKPQRETKIMNENDTNEARGGNHQWPLIEELPAEE